MAECTQCGITLRAQDLTCPECGHSRVDRIRPTPPMPHRSDGEPHLEDASRTSGAVDEYRSATVRGRWAQGMIFLVSLAVGYGTWATWQEIQLLVRIRDGLPVSLDQAAASDARVSTAGLLYLFAFVAAIVVYLMWLHRGVSNLTMVRSGDPVAPLRFSPGWAVGWYFVPIMNLFRPYQVMGELNRESNPQHRSSPLIGWWWALWVVAAVLGPGVTGFFSDTTAAEAIASDWRIVASNVVLLVDAVLIYLIIERICAWQDERARELGLM